MIQRNQDYINAFIEGYICAIIGERMTTAKMSELELDNAKHLAERFGSSNVYSLFPIMAN